MLTTTAYAAARGKSLRTVQRYLERGQLAGAALVEGQWLIPADAVPTTSSDVVPVSPRATSYDVAPTIPPGLWPLEDVAAFYGTTVGRIRVMGEHPRSPFIVGRFGPPDTHGHATWRVWVL